MRAGRLQRGLFHPLVWLAQKCRPSSKPIGRRHPHKLALAAKEMAAPTAYMVSAETLRITK
eukprot:257983-Pelagomonas_calceolata.AAC.3